MTKATRRARTRIRSSTCAPAPARKRLFAEVWLRNAFDTRYVPIAIPYPGFAPSGFIGENGRPRTFGISDRHDVSNRQSGSQASGSQGVA